MLYVKALFLLALLSPAAARRASLTSVVRAGGDVKAASLVGPLPGITAPLLVWLQGGPGASSLFAL
jgi:hypothetical protein